MKNYIKNLLILPIGLVLGCFLNRYFPNVPVEIVGLVLSLFEKTGGK